MLNKNKGKSRGGKNRMRKAQVALEYLFVMAVMLAVIIPFVGMTISEVSDNVRLAKAQKAVDELATKVDAVYIEGAGAKRTVFVEFPRGINSDRMLFQNRTIQVGVDISSGTQDVYATTKASVNGIIASDGGFEEIVLFVNDDGTVTIVEADSTQPYLWSGSVSQGTLEYGSSAILQVNASDEGSNVNQAYAQITGAESTQAAMTLISGNATSGRYNTSFVPSLLGAYYVTFYAQDTQGNTNHTEQYPFVCQDTQKPLLWDASVPSSGIVGMPATIYINASDNYQLGSVWANVTGPEDKTLVMGVAYGSRYSGSLNVSTAGNYSVVFNANDTPGNSNNTSTHVIQFALATDNIKPIFNQVSVPSSGNVLSTVLVWANVTDNVAVGSVWLNVTGAQTFTQYMTNASPTNYSASFPLNVAGTYLIFINANDTTGNQNNTAQYSLASTDSEKPKHSDYTSYLANDTSWLFYISVNITDNANISSVWANVTLPNSTTVMKFMDTISGNSTQAYYLTNYTAGAYGNYTIVVGMNDTSGNNNNTNQIIWMNKNYTEGTTTATRGFVQSGSSATNLDSNDTSYYELRTIESITSIYVLPGLPDPMDRNTYGYWGATLANPTNDAVYVTQVDIDDVSAASILNAVTGVRPATGWSVPDAYTVRWTGNQSVPARSAYDFIASIQGNSKNKPENLLNFTFTTSAGTFYDSARNTTNRIGDLAYVSLMYKESGSPTQRYYIAGLSAGSQKTFSPILYELGNSASINSGANLTIRVPAGWADVAASIMSGWSAPSVTGSSGVGWVITTSTTGSLQNSNLTFQFNATPPTNMGATTLYRFNMTVQGTESGWSKPVRPVADAPVQVVPGTPGLYVEHLSDAVAEDATSIQKVILTSELKSQNSEEYVLEYYDEAGGWTEINHGTVSTSEVSWGQAITSSFDNILDGSNKIKLRLRTENDKDVTLQEDYLVYNVWSRAA